MKGYLGETELGISERPPSENALLFVEMYGQIDGAHHHLWVLDQVARIINGAPVYVSEARWENGYTETRYRVGTSEQYEQWVVDMCAGEDGPESYTYNEGIAP